MSRSKEFDRYEVLREAIPVFAHHGYAGTSTGELLEAMGISRQSMYDTFGGKRNLYIQALKQHLHEVTRERIAILVSSQSPRVRLDTLLAHAIECALQQANGNCLNIGAICEFGCSDQEVGVASAAANEQLVAAVQACLREAAESGQLQKQVRPDEASHFVTANLCAIELVARGGGAHAHLQGIATLLMLSLFTV